MHFVDLSFNILPNPHRKVSRRNGSGLCQAAGVHGRIPELAIPQEYAASTIPTGTAPWSRRWLFSSCAYPNLGWRIGSTDDLAMLRRNFEEANEPEPFRERTGLAYALAILGSFLIVAPGLGDAQVHRTSATRANRAAEPRRALGKCAPQRLTRSTMSGGLIKEKHCRLRIEDAMKLVERSWQNAPAARSNLLERVAKALSTSPETAPSPFE